MPATLQYKIRTRKEDAVGFTDADGAAQEATLVSLVADPVDPAVPTPDPTLMPMAFSGAAVDNVRPQPLVLTGLPVADATGFTVGAQITVTVE